MLFFFPGIGSKKEMLAGREIVAYFIILFFSFRIAAEAVKEVKEVETSEAVPEVAKVEDETPKPEESAPEVKESEEKTETNGTADEEKEAEDEEKPKEEAPTEEAPAEVDEVVEQSEYCNICL